MARKRSRGFLGLGSTIQVKQLSGIGSLTNPSSAVGAAMPVLIGGGAAALVTLGIRYYMKPTSGWRTTVFAQAPWVGAAAGGLIGLAMMNMTSKPAGIGALTAALTVGVAFAATEFAAAQSLKQMVTSGFGAVVPEYSMRGLPARGVGAIAMEPTAARGYGAGPLGGTYGEDVQLRGLGNVNQSAFGTAMFGH